MTTLIDIKLQLEAMFIRDLDSRSLPDFQKSFDVDWEFLFEFNGKEFPNFDVVNKGDPFKAKNKKGTGDPEIKSPSQDIPFISPIVDGVILQLTNAFFDENAQPLGRNLARYIIFESSKGGTLFRNPNWGWEDQLKNTPNPNALVGAGSDIEASTSYAGLYGIYDKEGKTIGLTGQKIKDQIKSLIRNGSINNSLLSFIVWTMRQKPEMWKRLPLWDSFISQNGQYSYNKMDESILNTIRGKLQKAINNPTGPWEKGIIFKSWEALNTWGENPVSKVPPVVNDSCDPFNISEPWKQPATAKLECFGLRHRVFTARNIKIDDFDGPVQGRLISKVLDLPPKTELNRDLTANNGDLGLTTFLQRTRDSIIGGAPTKITEVPYSKEDVFLKVPIGGVQKPDFGFKTLLDDKFQNYLVDVIEQYSKILGSSKISPTQSLGKIYDVHLNGSKTDSIDPAWIDFWQVMLVMQENIERRSYVQNFVKADTDEEKDQRALDIEQATLANLTGQQRQAPPEPDPQETEEKIKGRQKFFKQCALLLNALSLKENYNQELKNRCTRTDPNEGPISKNEAVFEERLYMIENDEHQDNSLSHLIGTRSDSDVTFHDLPPRVFTYLKPKIKLFRVNNPRNGKFTETEFVFANRNDLNREANFTKDSNFLTAIFDKGEGAGVKDLSFEFNGTNPAEARNDIEASLSLHFQSFNDFIRERISYNGERYKFVDLIIQPTKEEKINKIVHPNQYDPSFYKIRLEVGYNAPDNIQEILSEEGVDPTDFQILLENTNKSYFLCMIDHDISINNDGTVDIKISYRAYVETLLKSNKFDALTTRKLLETRENNQRQLENVLGSGKCTIQEINELKTAINATEQKIRERSLRSIIERLLNRKKIFIVRVNEESASYFRTNGFFQSQNVVLEDVTNPSSRTPSNQLNVNSGGTINYILTNRMDSLRDFNYADESDRNVQFFYFGDLVHTICDILYEEDGLKFIKGSEKTRFLLGSFQFNPYSVLQSSSIKTLNIAEIPVSVDYFMNWFVNNIISQGDARKTYPIMVFLRNLLNNLLQQSLLEVCIDRNVEKTFRFQTSTISAFELSSHPLKGLTKVDDTGQVKTKLSINELVTQDILPFYQTPDIFLQDNAIDYMHNYVLINAIDSDLSKYGTGNRLDDFTEGIEHFNIGSNRGLVKNISFKKSDMQYVREARFFSHGFDGLLQLSAVYVANIEMFGNTLYYPGMTVYINPYGIGGTDIGSPSDVTSIANKLGFGGYHTITNVKSTITPDSFTTSITAQWYYSGDGRSTFGSNGLSRNNDSSSITDSNRSSADEKDCQNIIKAAEVNLVNLSNDKSLDSLQDLQFPEPSSGNITNQGTTEERISSPDGNGLSRAEKTSVFTFINGNGQEEQISIQHTDEQVIELSDGRTSVTYMLNGVTTGIYRTRQETGVFTEQTVTIRSLTIPRQNNRQIAVIGEPMTTETQSRQE